MNSTMQGNGRPSLHKSRGPIGLLLDLFSNVWFGITLLFLLFVYCSIGSAVPPLRQLPGLEMTEFEWFHWWPFNVLMILFLANLITTTLRRIPLRPVNYGVWTIHAGIIILTLGSYYYFTQKIEGDTPVFRRSVLIEVPGAQKPEWLVVRPGAQKSIMVGRNVWQFAISSTNNAWPILSGADEGKKTYSVNVSVTTPDGRTFTRQLLDGYPQYTEDILPGQGRAINNIGTKLVDDSLQLSLDYAPENYFYLVNTWALYVREVGSKEWIERPIEGLPRYHEYIASRDQVFADEPLPVRPIDIEVPARSKHDPIAGADVRVSAYLPYARIEGRWSNTGSRLNPVLTLAYQLPQTDNQTVQVELMAFNEQHRTTANGLIEFRWLNDRSEIDALPTDWRARLEVRVPEADLEFSVPVSNDVIVKEDGAFTAIEGTDISYRIVGANGSLPLGDRTVAVAFVDIKTPEKQFRRWVFDNPELNRDLPDKADPNSPHGTPGQPDARIAMRFHPMSAPIILVGLPDETVLAVVNGDEGREAVVELERSKPVSLLDGLVFLRIDGMYPMSQSTVKPYVVPRSKRDRNADILYRMIRLEIADGGERQVRWVPYMHYALPDETYSYRYQYRPERFQLADGKWIEVAFSRQRRQFPAPVALEDFTLLTHMGGYTGSAVTIRNYVSGLRFWENGQWTEPMDISVNDPDTHAGLFYFQSQWDPPMRNQPTTGMTYTGLSVGNRDGVYIQLAGCCIAVAGMIYAFYYKPILIRRRKEQALARHGLDREGDVEPDALKSQETEAVTV